MVYLRIALADENTYNSQLLPASCMYFNNSRARSRWSKKFSSIMKKEWTLSLRSRPSMMSNNSRPVLKKLRYLPLPPKNADVVQKLHPSGQPTEGITVAQVEPIC